MINQTGAGMLKLSSSAVLDNAPKATYDLQADSSITGGTITNSGTLEKTNGTGTSTISSALNSTGTLIVSSGTVDVSGAVAQVSGTALAAGNWQVMSTSTLDLTSAGNLNTIGTQASVTLNGPNSAFINLAALASNQGSFRLLGGQSFTTVGSLTNSGELTLSPGSVLAVTGNFTETSSAKLTLQLGGTDSSPTIGSLSVTGTISLAGSLTVTSTVTPAIGTVFNVVNNQGTSAITGTFAGLPEGATITVNGMTFKISYAGGSNRRSVTLKRTA
jgi:hypothetical protein